MPLEEHAMDAGQRSRFYLHRLSHDQPRPRFQRETRSDQGADGVEFVIGDGSRFAAELHNRPDTGRLKDRCALVPDETGKDVAGD